MNLLKKHPLLSILILAGLLRLVAVLFSKGFAFSDDHYETVAVACNWLQNGFFNEAGKFMWSRPDHVDIARFPLYNLFLFGIMKICTMCGATTLDQMMYAVRAVHGALSLLGVWCVYRIVEISTKSARWAAVAGLIVGAHFAMPFLAVRNLIEMVAGNFWIVASLLLYSYERDRKYGWLLAAGVLSGLAWMIRFEMVLAIATVPIALWWREREFRPAAVYCLGLGATVLLAGLIDWWLLGSFMASSINHVVQGLNEGEVYQTSRFVYPLVLLAFFIPPFSFVGFGLAFKRIVWKENLPLCLSSFAFLVIHSLFTSRQERYMIPIVPALMCLIVISLCHHWREHGFFSRHRRLWWGIASFSAAINFTLLPLFTTNYSHKGAVESLVQVQKAAPKATVLLVSPDVDRIYPYDYGRIGGIPHWTVSSWSEFDRMRQEPSEERDRVGQFVVFASDRKALSAAVDSIVSVFGPVEEYRHITPSLVDRSLHSLNPAHNKSQEAWLCKRTGDSGT